MCGISTKVRDFAGILWILAFVIHLCAATCPTENDEVQFTADEINGLWYGIAAVPPGGRGPSGCVELRVVASPTSGGFVIHFSGLTGDPLKNVTFDAVINHTNMTGVWIPTATKRTLGPMQHRFLAIEDNCAVLVICSFEINKKIFPSHAIIMSRKKELDPEILKKMITKLGVFFDESKILPVEQENCDSSET